MERYRRLECDLEADAEGVLAAIRDKLRTVS